MSESTDVCARCERSLGESAGTILCSGKTLARLPAEFRLCPHCSKSLTHWLSDKRRSSTNDAKAAMQASAPSRRRKLSRRQSIIRSLIVYGSVALITFLLIYQMLGNATRPPTGE